MSFHRESHNFATSSGTGFFKTDHSLRGLIWQIIIDPTTSTTKFDFTLLDSNGDSVLDWVSEVGSTNSGFGLEIPVSGYYTFKILNSTANENFRIRFTVKEPVYSGN